MSTRSPAKKVPREKYPAGYEEVIEHHNTGTNLLIKPRKTNYFTTLRAIANNSLSRIGSSSVALEVLYEIKGFDANGVLVNTG